MARTCMLMVVLAAGVVQYLPQLPAWPVRVLALAAWAGMWAALAAWLPSPWRARLLWPACTFALAWLVFVAWADARLADSLAPSNQDKVARVVLQVAGLVRASPDSRRFEAVVLSAQPAGVPGRLDVAWHAPSRGGPYGYKTEQADFPDLAPGQVWRMSLNLRRPAGVLNPHGFDYEGYLFARGVRATGSVRGVPQQVGDEPWSSLELAAQRIRHHVRQAMQPHLAGLRYGPVMLALALGDQASVPAQDWVVFNRSGITHLMSISGAHVTLVAALAGWTLLWIWRRAVWRGRGLAERVPAQVAAGLAALLMAWLYCLLAGWGVPARRTFFMLALAASAYVLRVPLGSSRLLCLAGAAVVVFDPWAVLAPGYWLSFGAVGVLLAVAGWHAPVVAARRSGGRAGGPEQHAMRQWLRNRWWGALQALSQGVRLQLAVTAGLMPLLAVWFNELSLLAPLTNAYAIPIVGLLLTPLSLLLALLAVLPGLDAAAGAVAALGHTLLQLMMPPTRWLAEHRLAALTAPAAPLWASALALAGVVLALLPKGWPLRGAGWLLALPALCWRPERPPPGAWDLIALDVGQGSAVVVLTARHALLFDTGLRSSTQNEAGTRIIAPYLRARGIRQLDYLVVSHADIDHAGGLRGILEALPVGQAYSSFDLAAHLGREAALLGRRGELPPLPADRRLCQQGVRWTVDEVTFEFLWPAPPSSLGRTQAQVSRNAASCVLRIRGRYHTALLTGDIGAEQERAMLQQGLQGIDVVLVPHHGSRNGSSAAFVHRLGAAYAVAQVGAWNRYGHPAERTQLRWERAGAQFWRTDRHGALSVAARASGLSIGAARQLHARYWHGR